MVCRIFFLGGDVAGTSRMEMAGVANDYSPIPVVWTVCLPVDCPAPVFATRLGRAL